MSIRNYYGTAGKFKLILFLQSESCCPPAATASINMCVTDEMAEPENHYSKMVHEALLSIGFKLCDGDSAP